jgi:hypothetical protein
MSPPVVDDAPGRRVQFQAKAVDVSSFLVLVTLEHLQPPDLDDQGQEDECRKGPEGAQPELRTLRQ